MNNNSNEISTGVALLLTLGVMLVIGMIISAFEPKCSMGGCNKEATEGSRYCLLHDISYRSYGNPDYNEVYRNSQKRQNESTKNSLSTNTQRNTSSSSGSKNSSSSMSTSKKSYNFYDSYDEGYEDVYENEDYDLERYYSDDDYASGVDDAMDELDW